MCGAPPGFREIPSQAALMALDWQTAPAMTARVMTAPPTMMDSLKSEALAEPPVVVLGQERGARRGRG